MAPLRSMAGSHTYFGLGKTSAPFQFLTLEYRENNKSLAFRVAVRFTKAMDGKHFGHAPWELL